MINNGEHGFFHTSTTDVNILKKQAKSIVHAFFKFQDECRLINMESDEKNRRVIIDFQSTDTDNTVIKNNTE